ncbi:MAG TPA: Hsp70 family protein [Kofleriaceae bacterium]|nr:Hsp70 family protein [Kofleriaceae bacterium]
MSSDPIVGIDLGTSNSVVAHTDDGGQVHVLADDSGYKIHPSVVSFHPNGGVIVGAGAKQRKVIDPQNTIYSVKRLIGRGFRSPEVQTAKQRMPYQIKEGANQLPMIVTRAGEFAIPEISAIVLDHMRNIATARLGKPVSRAVVTVPASFNDAQRSATATAGAIAGITVVRVLNEPTAAALAYGNTRSLNETIAVYDFGGGTFDITILKLRDQVYEVLGTAGNTFLGGDDLDERLVEKMVTKFLAENRVDLRNNEVAMMRLRAVAEQTKIELSRRSRAVVRIDEIAYGPKGVPLNLQIEITRDEFVSQVSDLIDRTFPVCQEALDLAKIKPEQVNDVILVGGTTKIPYVRDQVALFFNKLPRADINPEEAVAIGAALQAISLERILARPKTSSRVPVQKEPPRDESVDSLLDSFTDVDLDAQSTAVPELVPEEPRRGTAAYARPPTQTQTGQTQPGARSQTAYSMKRGATAGEEPTKPGAPPAGMRPESATPIGKMTKAIPIVARPPAPPAAARIPTAPSSAPPPRPPAAGASPKTMFGVPEGPAAKRTSQAIPVAPPPRELPPLDLELELPAPGASAASPSMPASPPGWGAPDLLGISSTQPLSPAAPIASPTAPTIALAPEYAIDEHAASAASTAKGMGAHKQGVTVQARAAEPSPATTAKGFPPPPAAAPANPYAGVALPAPVVLEVTPRGLGIGTVAGYCEELIRRNSRVPAEMKRVFTTSRDRQDMVRIVVCQGESRRLDSNTVIGDLVLQGLPPRPRGETSIEVTFTLDASGILQVRARDTQTGAEQRAQLDLIGEVPQGDVAASRDRLQQLRR